MTTPRLSVWPPLNPGVYARRPAERLPFPLEDPRCRVFSRARHALRRSLTGLGLRAGDRVLVPAYHHGSEIEALVSAGIDCLFYDATETLEPDGAVLDGLVDERCRALYLIHYLGFPQDAARWRAWCDERGLVLIEDAAQAWLAEIDGDPVGSFGHLSFFCLYKTFGLVDGAACLSAAPPDTDTAPGPFDLTALLKRHALWLEGRSERVADATIARRSSDGYSPTRDFELGDPYRSPARSTAALLPRVIESDAADRRRINFAALLDDLGELVEPPFSSLPPGSSPFGLPVMANDKAELLQRLADHGIAGLNFWSVPHPGLDVPSYPAAARRRDRTVCLPVHQELRAEDLERIVDAVKVRRRGSPRVGFEPLHDLAAERKDWTRLAAASRNIFSSYEWAEVWARHFLQGREVLLGRLVSSGTTQALVPLYRWGDKPLRVLRLIGHGPADQLGPVCRPEDARTVARALRRSLEERTDLCDVFLADYLPGDEPWRHLLDAKVLRRVQSPVLRFESGWDDYLRSKSANFREQVRRRERRLRQKHEVVLRLADDPSDIERDMETLLALYLARWSGDRPFVGAWDFHLDFARVAAERGWLRLWFLELDGRPVAAWYGFRYEGVESFYQAGRDPRWSDESVGLVLLAHTIREALDDGIHEYRFLRGGEDYKYRFTDEDPGLETAAWARAPVHGWGLQAAAAVGNWGVARRALGKRLARLPGAST